MEIIESGRGLPVLHEVDVVVVGGTTAAVTAALAAAEQGASVFLAAPRSYLGEDLCATGRLWLEPGEEPDTELAKTMFAAPLARRGLAYTYVSDRQNISVHRDDFMSVDLNDGLWGHVFGHSLEFDGPVTVTASLEKAQEIKEARLMLFQSAGDFGVGDAVVSVSDDKENWRLAGSFHNGDKRDYLDEALVLSCPLGLMASHVRLELRLAPGAKRIFLGQLQLLGRTAEPREGVVRNVTPMQIKRTLDDALIAAKIPFLYESCAVGALQDDAGKVVGVELVNRAGRQAVLAKVVVDATERATVARLAGAKAVPYPVGPQTFKRVVIGGEPLLEQVRHVPLQFPLGDIPEIRNWGKWNVPASRKHDTLFEYTLSLPMGDASFASFAAAEQAARDLTFHPGQVEDSERLFQIPPDPVKGRGAGLDAFRPLGLDHLFVLGACADIPRDAAAAILRPIEAMALGRRIGRAAALEAKNRKSLGPVGGGETTFKGGLDTKELLQGLRPWGEERRTVQLPARPIPVLGEYDVVVVGGGTSGACAGVGAARSGARTLVIENLNGLGGVATTGMIGGYCYGYLKGFTEELDKGVVELGAVSSGVGKMEWWRREIRKAGGDIWFGAQGAGAVVENGRVKGVVVATPQGRGVVLAKVVIDASGNADVAAAAGAECEFESSEHFGVQQAGLPRRELGASYINSDWTFANDSDMVDRWTVYVVARRLNGNAYDLGQLLDTRERRHIVGDHTLSPMDYVNSRKFPDTINIASSGSLDKHSEPIHPYLRINTFAGGITSVPYRCLLPKGLDGILVIGIGLSADADAAPSIRMQPDMQNQGYAAGLAAAMIAKENVSTRGVDFPKLQARLVEEGCIPPEYAGQPDSFPPSQAAVEEAARTLAEKDYSLLRLLMIDPDKALPLLRGTWRDAATPAGKLRCAHVLGMMGDATGVETLVEEVEKHDNFDGEDIAYYYPRLTWLDSYMLALGKSKDGRALKPLLSKLSLLSKFPAARPSHLYCLALALEWLGDPGAAPALAAELLKAGAADNAALTLEEAMGKTRSFTGDEAVVKLRSVAGVCGFIALELARCLFRCGDHEGLARKTLETFANDVRGPIALHARAVLGTRRQA